MYPSRVTGFTSLGMSTIQENHREFHCPTDSEQITQIFNMLTYAIALGSYQFGSGVEEVSPYFQFPCQKMAGKIVAILSSTPPVEVNGNDVSGWTSPKFADNQSWSNKRVAVHAKGQAGSGRRMQLNEVYSEALNACQLP